MCANNNFRHWTAILAPLPAVLAGRLFSRVRVRERDAKGPTVAELLVLVRFA
jgi:hypothetical protein